MSSTHSLFFSSVSLPVVSLEKMPCLSRADSASHVRLSSSSSPLKSSSLTPPASQRSNEKLTNGRGSSGPSTPRSTTPPSSLDRRPSPARSPLDRRATPSPSPLDRKGSLSPSPSHRTVALPALLSLLPLEKKHQNGTKTSARSHRRLSGQARNNTCPFLYLNAFIPYVHSLCPVISQSNLRVEKISFLRFKQKIPLQCMHALSYLNIIWRASTLSVWLQTGQWWSYENEGRDLSLFLLFSLFCLDISFSLALLLCSTAPHSTQINLKLILKLER